MKVPVLETERLILRPFAQTDEEAVLAIYGDPVVMKFVPLIPLANLAEARAHLQEHLLPVYETPGECLFAICLKEENSPIGYVHVSGDDSHDFGYALRKEFWGHGYATEAALAVLDFVREQGVLYVTATHDVNNPASGRVMQRLGMHYCYSYKELWQPKNFWVTFRMYQLNFDGDSERVYREYWDRFEEHFIEENVNQ